jgi:hypothetical protein
MFCVPMVREENHPQRSSSMTRLLASVVLVIALLFCLVPVQAAGIFIPAPNRADMVHDAKRNVVYITDGGTVLRYDLTQQSFLEPFILGGDLKGIDLSPDENTLVVADTSHDDTTGWVHVIDLETEAVSRATFSLDGIEGGSWSVAFGKDGKALVTTRFRGSGWVPLRLLNPATETYSIVKDTSYPNLVIDATVRQDSMLCSSADGTIIAFEESNISDGAWGRYRVSDAELVRRMGYDKGTSWSNYEIGVNRDGTQYAIPTYGGAYIYNAAYKRMALIGQYAGPQPVGVVYHPSQDIVYFSWQGTQEVRSFDTITYREVARYNFQSVFQNNGNRAYVDGRLKISRDGRLLFATVSGGVRYVRLPKPGGPVITSVTPNAGKTNTAVTIEGSNFTGATSVTFNGTPATFQVVSATKITTTVPQGATTGLIVVTTPIDYAESGDAFIVDNSAPSVKITSPSRGRVLYNTINSVLGTAADNTGGSGVETVTITFTRPVPNTTNVQYWTGTAWSNTVANLPCAVWPLDGGYAWSNQAALPSGSNLPTGDYTVTAQAVDKAGNSASVSNAFRVIADLAPPTITITTPQNGATATGLPSVSGTVSDTATANSSGVAKVLVLLYRADGFAEKFEYWNGSTWGRREYITASVNATTAPARWSISPLPSGTNLTRGAYFIKAFAYDRAGNQSLPAYSSFMIR